MKGSTSHPREPHSTLDPPGAAAALDGDDRHFTRGHLPEPREGIFRRVRGTFAAGIREHVRVSARLHSGVARVERGIEVPGLAL